MRRHRATGCWAAGAVVVLVAAGCGATQTDRVTAGGVGDDPTSTSTTTEVPDTSSTTGADTTTTTSSSTTTSTTTVSPAPSTSRHITGTHAGTERFALGTGRCAVLDHHLDELWTLTDGTAWSFASAYCGTLDAHGVWSGTGTFTMTAPDGSFTGRSVSTAHVPSPGVPYRLEVEGGTGAFGGVTGTCTVDEHLRTISFGVQEHRGSFACDLTGVAAPTSASASGS